MSLRYSTLMSENHQNDNEPIYILGLNVTWCNSLDTPEDDQLQAFCTSCHSGDKFIQCMVSMTCTIFPRSGTFWQVHLLQLSLHLTLSSKIVNHNFTLTC